MTVEKDKIFDLIVETIKAFCIENDISIDLSEGRKTRLFGGGGPLDSISLVSLIVQIEETIENKTGKAIIIADEKAMSRKTSPFASVGLLTDYVLELLTEDEK
ncbi:MAG: hypothetical protein RMJ44_05650 [Cytophagales bacterium]|nr:hypothetical protein [Bernardetiaceae bacterium]MDW8210551.1 hypothetical protein [Cytophagales bacterium]